MKTILCILAILTLNTQAFDFLKLDDGTPVKWDKTKPIPYKILNEDLREATVSALNIWNAALDNSLNFVEQDVTDKGIIIDLVPIIKNPNGLLVEGVTVRQAVSGIMKKVRIQIGAGFSYPEVVLHEIGHALGMEHATQNYTGYFQSQDPPVMYPVINEFSGKTLHVDDIVGIQTLYGVTPLSNFNLGTVKTKVRGKMVLASLDRSDISPFWNFGEMSENFVVAQTTKYKFLNKGTYNAVVTARGFYDKFDVQIGRVKHKK